MSLKLETQKIPLEEVEQGDLARYLDHNRYLWLHIPNEGNKSMNYHVKMARLGLKTGAPDVLIFDVPPKYPKAKGVAIELKRISGSKTSKEQKQWQADLQAKGWVVGVCKGAQAAINMLQELGFTERPITEITAL